MSVHAIPIGHLAANRKTKKRKVKPPAFGLSFVEQARRQFDPSEQIEEYLRPVVNSKPRKSCDTCQGIGWNYDPNYGYAACADCNDDAQILLTDVTKIMARREFNENTEEYELL